MKRLFEVNGEYFETKLLAKQARGANLSESGAPRYAHTIKVGPDHWRFGMKK